MPINVEVTLKDGESSHQLIKRFFKKCKKQDIIKEYLYKTSFFRTRAQKKKDKILRNRYMKETPKK